MDGVEVSFSCIIFFRKEKTMRNVVLIAMVVGLVSMAGAIVAPQAYFPFENTNGSYGAGSMSNPAWADAVSGTAPDYVGSTAAPTWPEITTDGVKGDAFYATDPEVSGKTMTLNYSYEGGNVQDLFDGVISYTITAWVNSRTGDLSGSNTYLMHGFGAGPAIKWRDDGRMQVLDAGGSWLYENYADRRAGWMFFAFTRSSTGWAMYHGDLNSAVSAGTAVAATPAAGGDCSRIVIGGYTYNGSDEYANYDMDELRIYASSVDDSGALGIDDLEAIRQFDLVPEPMTLALMGFGMLAIRRKKA